MADHDADLLKRMASDRDERAFACFYDRHAARVYGLLLKLLRNQTDADDVLQEVFLQVWQRGDQFDPLRSLAETWLLMIARTRAIDRLRKRREELGSDWPEPARQDDPARGLEQNEAAERVESALDRLPNEQRDAIRLSFFDGLTHEEIARRMALPLGTVKTRIRLGMNRLRDRFRNDERPEVIPA